MKKYLGWKGSSVLNNPLILIMCGWDSTCKYLTSNARSIRAWMISDSVASSSNKYLTAYRAWPCRRHRSDMCRLASRASGTLSEFLRSRPLVLAGAAGAAGAGSTGDGGDDSAVGTTRSEVEDSTVARSCW
jgi:hypothetical protein